jgi:FkbM family methyltransferase
MKIKESIYLLGLRPRSKTYGHRIDRYELPQEGTVEYATWLHPKQVSYQLNQSEIDFLRGFIHTGDCAIDIGARTGDTALPIALACGPSGTGLAFEPNPYVFPVLEANSHLNRDKAKIVPLCLAATETDGEFLFEYSDSGYGNGGLHYGISAWRHGHAFPLKVRGVSLAMFLAARYPDVLRRLRYIKIDVEGYDLNVLHSIRDLLSKHRPHVRVEVYKWLSEERRREMFQFLSDLGYSLRSVAATWQWGPLLNEADMVQRQSFDIYAVPRRSGSRFLQEIRGRERSGIHLQRGKRISA